MPKLNRVPAASLNMRHDPFNRSQLPTEYDRPGRVRLLRAFALTLLEGKRPNREASLYVGGAIAAWLEQGGDLVGDYLKVSAPPGSHQTPQAIHAESMGGFDITEEADEE